MKKIIVAGASGFVGQNLLKKILKKNYDFCAISNTKKINKENWLSLDLSISKNYKNLPQKVYCIVHLAGDPRTFLRRSDGLKQIKKNLSITKKLAYYATKKKCKKFIFLSSVYVYSGNKNFPFKENMNLKPLDFLGKSKLKSENFLLNYFKKVKIQCTVLRAFTLYGPHYRKNQFLSLLKKKINTDNRFIRLLNPNPLRDFIHIDDLTNLITLIINNKKKYKHETFNVGTGLSYSIKNIAEKMNSLSKKKKILIFNNNQKEKFKNDFDHIANISKVINFFKWRPKIKLNTGLKKFYEN